MKVSTTQPFEVIYSIFQHEFLGYLLGAFVVQVNSKGELTLQYQNLSSQNAQEFSKNLTAADLEVISWIDSIQQDNIIRKFYNKKVKPEEFFLKVYHKEKGDKNLQEFIENFIEERKQHILHRLADKKLFIMAKDGNPSHKRLFFAQEPATVLFHFRRNEEDIHYFPTLKYQGQKLEFQYKNAFILGNQPAWMVLEDTIYTFAKEVDGNKLKPFLNKKFIAVKRQMENTYFKKFVAPLVASFDVFAVGFDIKTESHTPIPHLRFSEMPSGSGALFDLANDPSDTLTAPLVAQSQMLVELSFAYGAQHFMCNDETPVKVYVEEDPANDNYIFHRIKRQLSLEADYMAQLAEFDLAFKPQSAKRYIDRGDAFGWLGKYKEALENKGFVVHTQFQNQKKYFIGKTKISLEIQEKRDWFDIHALIQFGKFEIPFLQIRKLILQKKTEFALPDGSIAVIPEAWIERFAQLFALAHTHEGDETPTLPKYHLSMLAELQAGEYAQVRMSRKLESFRSFEKIEDYPLPNQFEGILRNYQKAGYNWLRFLNEYRFGGCLADDMGLGKTVQTLALLQAEKEAGVQQPSLLVMPTSLMYNWQIEAQKFTPQLKTLVYAGQNRNKNTAYFELFDLIITSYGVLRVDAELLCQYKFHYAILDESQAIKNPSSAISQIVRELHTNHRLILTGTPLENSTLDLWTQMSFINPGLLGTQQFFKNEFLNPIERQKSQDKTQKLSDVVKPFILRRLKSQVAQDLPEKIENIHYAQMTEPQANLYEKVKSHYRNRLIEQFEKEGLAQSQLLVIEGLTKLRQIANHPKMIDPEYDQTSGKFEDICYKLEGILSENYKVLVFSQFTKHLALFRQHLDQLGIRYAYLDGGTKDRQQQVNLFQNSPEIQIFLISLKAGGTGLNLTAAEYVFLLDPWWNPAIEAQAVDRAHRIGQKNTVFTYKFITQHTVEEKILALQQSKKKLADDLISSEDGFVKSLSQDDLLKLLD
ncbi:MAG TPA: helicase SNF2 [Microscillaceae bacterium]|nr:helicase SNF2 [Microscillaceae bacterium]